MNNDHAPLPPDLAAAMSPDVRAMLDAARPAAPTDEDESAVERQLSDTIAALMEQAEHPATKRSAG